jgi:hypothetical protein
METAMANASSSVSSVMVIVVLAFVIGNAGVGTYVRRKGGSAALVQFLSSLATLFFLLVGVILYLNR